MYKIVADTLFTGKKVVHLPTCQSTNDTAAEFIQSGRAIAGTVIIADSQTKGRGQRGNSWQAAPGLNLTLSLIWSPSFIGAADSFVLNMAVSLAIAETVAHFLPDAAVAVKWPNDIYADGQKICGTLIENTLQGAQIRYSIVGIGLNVNQTDFNGIVATSLKLVSGQQQSLPEVFDFLMRQLEKRYLQLQTQGNVPIRLAYLNRLYRRGQPAAYTDLRNDVPVIFEGIIEDIDTAGRLLVRTQNSIETFDLKQIQFNA
ncbi:biotin--[acetyl-CoA-carboxylase] ligase [Rhodoflexus caldus]|uniref:biotin--[acetyl-CoA-carboxylase] ligase n=1 Tax=Rhodoflexus caldus TaxID=2891236 RepID=UPI002029B7AF|nr:biotin--[acetyl-CoA-carboxylase] ligase [Rhodoflexus caldus]